MDLTVDPTPVQQALGITGRPFRPEPPLPGDAARGRPTQADRR